jgi:hypothetical protein
MSRQATVKSAELITCTIPMKPSGKVQAKASTAFRFAYLQDK